MKHFISEIVQLSITRNGGNLNGFVPTLAENDFPRLYPILNHLDGKPFLTPDLRTCPRSWETDVFLGEHPYLAISFVLDGTQYTKALVEPFPPEYPAHRVLHHAADALEIIDCDRTPGNDWEKDTMRNQVELSTRKAMAGVQSLTDDQVQTLFDELLQAKLPTLTMVTALSIATGDDPHLKRVITDHIDFPQVTVFHEDAKSMLEQAAGKLSSTTMGHVAKAMGFLPIELALEKAPVPSEHKTRIIRAAEKAGIPRRLITTIQQEL